MTTKKTEPTAAEHLADLEHRISRGDDSVTVEMLVDARRDAEEETAREIAELHIVQARKLRIAAERVDAVAKDLDSVAGENKRKAALQRVRRAIVAALNELDEVHADRSTLIAELRDLATESVGVNHWRIGDRVKGGETSVTIDGRSVRAELPEHQVRDAVDAGFAEWRKERRAANPRRRRPAPPTELPTATDPLPAA